MNSLPWLKRHWVLTCLIHFYVFQHYYSNERLVWLNFSWDACAPTHLVVLVLLVRRFTWETSRWTLVRVSSVGTQMLWALRVWRRRKRPQKSGSSEQLEDFWTFPGQNSFWTLVPPKELELDLVWFSPEPARVTCLTWVGSSFQDVTPEHASCCHSLHSCALCFTANQSCQRHAGAGASHQRAQKGGAGLGDGHRQQRHQLQRQLHHPADDICVGASVLRVRSSSESLSVCANGTLSRRIRWEPSRDQLMGCSHPPTPTPPPYDLLDVEPSYQHRRVSVVYSFCQLHLRCNWNESLCICEVSPSSQWMLMTSLQSRGGECLAASERRLISRGLSSQRWSHHASAEAVLEIM